MFMDVSAQRDVGGWIWNMSILPAAPCVDIPLTLVNWVSPLCIWVDTEWNDLALSVLDLQFV